MRGPFKRSLSPFVCPAAEAGKSRALLGRKRRANDRKGQPTQGQELQPHQHALHHSADVTETLKTYVQDAQEEGDQELVDFFSTTLENNLEASERAKELLVARLEQEQE